jgi:hypothetical protein
MEWNPSGIGLVGIGYATLISAQGFIGLIKLEFAVNEGKSASHADFSVTIGAKQTETV